MTPEVNAKAIMLVMSIRAALAAGVKHYDKRGNLLPNAESVLRALVRDGSVVLDDSETRRRDASETHGS